MRPLKTGLYIMTYHEVSWEADHFLRGSCMVTTPERLRAHLECYRSLGKVIPYSEGMERLRDASLEAPTFVVVFDDGFSGTLRHGLPLLKEFDVSASMSLSPGFLHREELFWRLQLCFIANCGALDKLKVRLKEFGYDGGSVRDWTNWSFSHDVRDCIKDVFMESCPPHIARDAWRHFLSIDDCRRLAEEEGFTFINHSWSHYYYGRLPSADVAEDFLRSHKELASLFGSAYTGDVAIPFGGAKSFTREGLEAYRALNNDGVVLACNRMVNFASEYSRDCVGRIAVDNLSPDELMGVLSSASMQGRKATQWHE